MAANEDKAVQIASFRNNRIIIDTDGFNQILDKVGDRPLAIISVNGPMRTGKSYILSHFLRYLADPEGQDWFKANLCHEFHWKNSSERQTTGILVWSEPFMAKQNGKEVAVLLMDTQGCFDEKTTTNENSLIFALSCLLSSTLVYNVKNNLTEDVLQFLQLFIGYAKMPTEQETAETFSKLIFLIRDWASPQDFAFGFHDDASAAGLRNFKREKLDLQSDMAQEVRVAHKEILSSFTSVGCCLMPYPGSNLAMYDKVDHLKPDFVRAVCDFVPRLLSQVTLKRLGGSVVTGHEFKRIIERYAEIFENHEVPPVHSVVESTAEYQNSIAANLALKFYEREMHEMMTGEGLPDAELEKLHQSKHDEALKMFRHMKRIAHDKIQETFRQRLEDDIAREFQACVKINEARRDFQQFKSESEQEREEMRQAMEERIRKSELEVRKLRNLSAMSGILEKCLEVASEALVQSVIAPTPVPRLSSPNRFVEDVRLSGPVRTRVNLPDVFVQASPRPIFTEQETPNNGGCNVS